MFKTKMYFSGSMKNERIDKKILECGAYRLYTFAYPKEAYEFLNYADSLGLRANLLIDSGAFSAWNIGKPVQLEHLLGYNQYLLQHYGDRHSFQFIALDVIPGKRGRAATPQEIKDGMDTSFTNYLKMKAVLPCPVLPVYHSGEPEAFRDAFLNETDYICLSMNQTMSEKNRVQWARDAFKPGVKLHGLAATGNKMLTQVDWYSVDSAGWLMVAGMGSILIPAEGGLKPLAISKESPARHTADQHYTTLKNRSPIDNVIAKFGYNPEELQTNYIARMLWNIDMWLNPPWTKKIQPSNCLFPL